MPAQATPIDPQLQEWLAAGRYFEHAGHRSFYRDDGDGPPLLCLHGYPTASWDWHRVWPLLHGHYRLVAPDLLGFGFSDKPRDHAYSIADQATRVERLLVKLGLHEVHLLAHDYGDTVAQELMTRHQTRLQSGEAGVRLLTVTLLNGGLFPETHRARPIQTLLRSPLAPVLLRLFNARALGRNMRAIFGADTPPDAAELARFWALINYNGGRAIMGRLLHYIGERRRSRERWVGALVDAPMPLRLVAGMDDPVSGAHMVERYRQLVPQPDVVELPGIGHYPQWEAAERVAVAVIGFAR
ncbi:alpha/beta hydrolase [Pseudoxanthomonas gei]|uniref:Alpha/beta hydrolase n=1 Tax=Pseudoxanthomonas gei TaxID=1383030 RepID=A0ABX0ACV0_9GAMM|nr:alpha/beta hydrolase [Pseudoxanthomonas gei]NDK39394.1 alpha/beta hydrolase [Pseudoxanthomonas gei]